MTTLITARPDPKETAAASAASPSSTLRAPVIRAWIAIAHPPASDRISEADLLRRLSFGIYDS